LSSPELPDQQVAKDLYRRALLIDAAHGGLKSGERKSIEARLKN
jgi:superfamily II helicase